ncbi:hypothetical protein D3C81_1027220 [compost metagenome]
MSAVILSFPAPFALASLSIRAKEPPLLYLAECGEQPFISDLELGLALGYAHPLVAVTRLYAQHFAELRFRSRVVDLYQPDAEGRISVCVFDLQGAMRLCELARTPAAGLLYARLGARAIAEFVVPTEPGPKAQVLSFPKGKKVLRPGSRLRHG